VALVGQHVAHVRERDAGVAEIPAPVLEATPRPIGPGQQRPHLGAHALALVAARLGVQGQKRRGRDILVGGQPRLALEQAARSGQQARVLGDLRLPQRDRGGERGIGRKHRARIRLLAGKVLVEHAVAREQLRGTQIDRPRHRLEIGGIGVAQARRRVVERLLAHQRGHASQRQAGLLHHAGVEVVQAVHPKPAIARSEGRRVRIAVDLRQHPRQRPVEQSQTRAPIPR
jgi:hypothetical protein